MIVLWYFPAGLPGPEWKWPTYRDIWEHIYKNRDLSRNDGNYIWNYIWTHRGYICRESLALLSTQYVGTYLGMMVWLGWDGNDPAAASSLSFPHMPTTLPIYRQVTLQKHTIVKYGVQISEFRFQNSESEKFHSPSIAAWFPCKNTESTKMFSSW